MRGVVAVAIAAASVGVAARSVAIAAAPEPDPVPRRWQLDVKVGPLRVTTVDAPRIGPRTYYYLTYRVTNNSGQDLLFAPSFELATDHGERRRSGRDVPAEVTRALLERLGNPLIQDQISILGMMLQGEENAKDGLVIWPANDLKADEVVIYGSGFSGESATLEMPDPTTGQPRQVVLRKTLMVRYKLPGDLRTDVPGQRELPPFENRWIMR